MKAKKYNYDMMNKVKYASLAIALLFAFSSCDDWLYLEPADGVITEEYWQSESDLFAGVMGCYASMLGGGSGNYSVPQLMFLWGEMRADFLREYQDAPNDYTLMFQGDIKSNNSLANWGSFYTTINYCNTVLEKGPGILDLDASFSQKELNQYRAEALTIRALMYFYLTRMYRDVPIITKASTSDLQNFTISKSPAEEVWAQIEADLLEAEKYIPFSYNNGKQEDKGRVTAYTVYAILADFYLWIEEYAKSEEYCDKIINSGKYWMVKGDMDWYYNLYEAENSSESIFELQFDIDIPNPLYSMCITNRNYRANPDVMEIFWPTDELLVHADSADIRSDRGSYVSSLNYMIWKSYGKTRYATRSNSALETDYNWIVYRYADILLMKAENMAAQLTSYDESTGAEILDIIKQIRKRANASDLTDEGEPGSRSGLLYYILNERAREFAFEGKRWFDILRFAKRDNYSRLDALITMYETCAPSDKLISIQSKINNPDFHYLPLPETDVLNSGGKLEQNPYYAK
jgi:hypothetical protein